MVAAGIGAGSASAQLKDELARQEAEMANYQSAAKKKRNLHEATARPLSHLPNLATRPFGDAPSSFGRCSTSYSPPRRATSPICT